MVVNYLEWMVRVRVHSEELQQNMPYEPEWLKLSADKYKVPHEEKKKTILISHKNDELWAKHYYSEEKP